LTFGASPQFIECGAPAWRAVAEKAGVRANGRDRE
jgi:hypothetical protein